MAYMYASMGYDTPNAYEEMDLIRSRMAQETAMLKEQMQDMRHRLEIACVAQPQGVTYSGTTTTSPYSIEIDNYNRETKLNREKAMEKILSWGDGTYGYDPDIKCESCGEEPHEGEWIKDKCSMTWLKEFEEAREKKDRNFRNVYWHRRMMNPELFEEK